MVAQMDVDMDVDIELAELSICRGIATMYIYLVRGGARKDLRHNSRCRPTRAVRGACLTVRSHGE